jgi:hypothetical protein
LASVVAQNPEDNTCKAMETKLQKHHGHKQGWDSYHRYGLRTHQWPWVI